MGIPPNIAAAIRRSQEARGAVRARRRRTVALVAGLAMVAAAPVFLSLTGIGNVDMVEAAVAKAQSLADMLNQRSPGQRTAAQLTKTKHRQMALAKMRPLVRKPVAPPLAPGAHELANILLGAPPELPVAIAAAPVPPIAVTPPTLGAIVSPPPANTVLVPPGGGTPGGGPPASNPTPQPREPVIVTPPVPEPATWMTMLLGFGLMGWRVRSAKSARQQLRAA